MERTAPRSKLSTAQTSCAVLRIADCRWRLAPPTMRAIVWASTARRTHDKDRQVNMACCARDKFGYALAFRQTTRHAFKARPVLVNVPGQKPQRAQWRVDFSAPHQPRSIVLYVPNLDRARDFYTERLGFRVTNKCVSRPLMFPAKRRGHTTVTTSF